MASGFRDWKIQRLSALIMGIYFVYLVSYAICYYPMTFMDWQHLFQRPLIQVASFLVLVALLWHAWIGVWTVTTDYIKQSTVRWVVQAMVLLTLMGYGVWGVMILAKVVS